MFKKSTTVPAKIFVVKSSKCFPSFHKYVLEIKPNPFNTHCVLKLLFTRSVNAMFFLGKIDDIITSFTPRSMQDLPMLIISAVSFSAFISSFV